jgi:hypothetical protein
LFSKPTTALFSFGFICRSSRYWDCRVGWLRLFSSVCCSVPSLVSLLFSILLFSGAAAYVCMRGRARKKSACAFGTIWKKTQISRSTVVILIIGPLDIQINLLNILISTLNTMYFFP